jgi:septal ring factor EnvC (AmiA/AmiB activator)
MEGGENVKTRIAAAVIVAFLVGMLSMILAVGQARPTARGLKQRVQALESKVTNLETQLANHATDVSGIQAQLVRQASDMNDLEAKTINLDESGGYQGQIGGEQVNAPSDCADGTQAIWRAELLSC